MSGYPRDMPDSGVVRAVAKWFGGAAAELESMATRLERLLAAPTWEGEARDRWLAEGRKGVEHYRAVALAAAKASQALHKLATELDAARDTYDAAVSSYEDAKREIVRMQLLGAGLGPLVLLDDDLIEDKLRQRIEDSRDDAEAAAGRAATARDDALAAGRRAGEILDPLTEELKGLGTFAGSGPGASGASGFGLPEPDASFLALLFGSVRDNYSSGHAFQKDVLSRLQLPENTTRYDAMDGSRFLRVAPDAITSDEVYEIKAGRYVYSSRQLRGELFKAASSGRGFTLVVGENTRVSIPLQEQVRNSPYGGEIVRAHPKGGFTTLDGRPVEQADGGGWRYRNPDDAGSPPDPDCDGGLGRPLGREAERLTVEEYSENPSRGIAPFMPLPGLPVPAPAPAPAPAPIPRFPILRPLIIP
ncbi:MAG: hypothetical protein M3323_12515 [Actinomycetota bacterium]|nr:hypothetical protein [Actinomycetota bacterium]